MIYKLRTLAFARRKLLHSGARRYKVTDDALMRPGDEFRTISIENRLGDLPTNEIGARTAALREG